MGSSEHSKTIEANHHERSQAVDVVTIDRQPEMKLVKTQSSESKSIEVYPMNPRRPQDEQDDTFDDRSVSFSNKNAPRLVSTFNEEY